MPIQTTLNPTVRKTRSKTKASEATQQHLESASMELPRTSRKISVRKSRKEEQENGEFE